MKELGGSNYLKILIGLMILMCLSSGYESYGQTNELSGQYYRVMQAYAPGLVGANDFMELTTGSRRQWVGVQQAPNYNYLNINTSLAANRANSHKRNSLRVGNLSPYNKKSVKIGLGSYFMNVSSKYVDSYKMMFSVASHVSLTKGTYLSLGTSFGLFSQAMDINNIWVLYPDQDLVYQDFINSGGRQMTFNANVGMALSSSRYYISYSVMNAIDLLMSGFNTPESDKSTMMHHSLGGIRLSINQNLELIPNYFIRYASITPVLLDVGIRAQYKDVFLTGVSFRNDGSIISMIGLDIIEKFDFGYSYEIKQSNSFLNNLHTHEITLGVKLFNYKMRKSIW